MKFSILTQYDGRLLFLNPDHVHYFEPYDGQTHIEYPSAETRIETSHFCFYVKQDFQRVATALTQALIGDDQG